MYHTPVSLSSSAPSSHAHSTASDNHSSSIFIDLTQSVSSSSSSSHSVAPSSRVSAAAPDASALSTLSPSYIPPSPPASTGGESIYRTIMNRLTVLEANTTLYARYVEEQTTGMRDVLRRLTEDLGRLEGIVSSGIHSLYPFGIVDMRTGQGASPAVPPFRNGAREANTAVGSRAALASPQSRLPHRRGTQPFIYDVSDAMRLTYRCE